MKFLKNKILEHFASLDYLWQDIVSHLDTLQDELTTFLAIDEFDTAIENRFRSIYLSLTGDSSTDAIDNSSFEILKSNSSLDDTDFIAEYKETIASALCGNNSPDDINSDYALSLDNIDIDYFYDDEDSEDISSGIINKFSDYTSLNSLVIPTQSTKRSNVFTSPVFASLDFIIDESTYQTAANITSASSKISSLVDVATNIKTIETDNADELDDIIDKLDEIKADFDSLSAVAAPTGDNTWDWNSSHEDIFEKVVDLCDLYNTYGALKTSGYDTANTTIQNYLESYIKGDDALVRILLAKNTEYENRTDANSDITAIRDFVDTDDHFPDATTNKYSHDNEFIVSLQFDALEKSDVSFVKPASSGASSSSSSASGSEWHAGSGTPLSSVGSVDDFYLDSDTGDIYKKASSGWGSSIANIKGDAGTNGSDGADGADGTNGADGADGADGINGTNGTDGEDGADGVDGAQWHTGTGTPDSATGIENDFYLDTDTGDVYQKTSSGWGDNIANIKGADGTNGADGSDGADGADGESISIENWTAGDYTSGDIVQHNSNFYICANDRASTDTDNPADDIDNWRRIDEELNTYAKYEEYAKQFDFDINYNSDDSIDYIEYSTDLGTIKKELSYDTDGNVSSISLLLDDSDIAGIDNTKTFSYDTDGNLTSIAYS